MKIFIIIILLFSINILNCNQVQILTKKVFLLQQLNKQYQKKIDYQQSIIIKQQSIIQLDSLQFNYYQKQINLYKIQIKKYNQITKIDSLQIQKLKNNQDTWYNSKQLYFIYGMLMILTSSYIVKNVK